ncbi:MAG: hypothetical protein HYV67_04840 [Candidatus Taylorbacteria bacterium]|nr:hypothetical protein [Candidatus Taylorbacteria bacterium]
MKKTSLAVMAIAAFAGALMLFIVRLQPTLVAGLDESFCCRELLGAAVEWENSGRTQVMI